MKKRHLLNFMLSAIFLLTTNVLMAQTMTAADFETVVGFDAIGANGATSSTQSARLADLDGDGKLDLMSGNFGSTATYSFISVWRNISVSGTIATGSFDTRQDFAVQAQPMCIEPGDFDHDGKLDLAIAHATATGRISVLRNTSVVGTISFTNVTATAILSNPGNTPWIIAVGDIDGDGWADLAVANSATVSYVSVYRNTSTTPGTITFVAGANVVTALGTARCVALGDLNADGKADLAVINTTAGNKFPSHVSVFQSTGSGTLTFGAEQTFAVGDGASDSSPWAVTVGDIDLDGKPDLAVTNSRTSLGGNSIAVLQNKTTSATIEFEAYLLYSCLGTAKSIGISDINGDGKPDVVATSGNALNNISVYINTGILSGGATGTFVAGSFSTRLDIQAGAIGLNSLAIGDIDGDGKPDLVGSNSGSVAGSNKVLVRRNNLNWTGNSSIAGASDLNAYAIRNGEIRVNGEVSKNAVATLYDIQGRVILVRNMEEGNLNVIPTLKLKTGIYLLLVKDNQRVQGFKIPVNE